jgi:glutamine synthetase
MNVREVLEFAKKNKVQIVDLKFVDLIGTWQHFSIPTNELTEDLFKDGSGLDGSSIRGPDTEPRRQRRGSDYARDL